MRIGFVGAGKMGLALAKGVDQSRFQCSIAISDPSVEARSLFLSQLNHVKVMPGSFLSREDNGKDPGLGHIRVAWVSETEECIEAAHRLVEFAQEL